MNMSDFDLIIAARDTANLKRILANIKNATMLPKHLIFILPQGTKETSKVIAAEYLPFTVKILECPEKGQVPLRIYGINNSKAEYVVFMDDDIEFHNTLFDKLLKFLNKNENSVVGPFIFNEDKTQLYSSGSKFKEIFDNFVHGIGYASEKSGRIGRSGVPFYVDPSSVGAREVEVEWLPGGVQAIKKSFFPTKNYYPYDGKAFCEDLFLSHIYFTKGLKMFVVPVRVFTKVERLPFKALDLFADFRARLRFVISSQRSVIRMLVWYFSFIMLNLMGR